MKKVERLDVPQELEKPIEMYSCLQMPLGEQGHFEKEQQPFNPNNYTRIVYLGQFSSEDEYGDLFLCYFKGGEYANPHLWRGKLNDGVY